MRALTSFFLGAFVGLCGPGAAGQQNTFELSCATIRADTNRADLIARFGATNVVDAKVLSGRETMKQPLCFSATPPSDVPNSFGRKSLQDRHRAR